MTIHEALGFLARLTDFLAEAPTQHQINRNLADNTPLLGNNAQADWGFIVRGLETRGFIERRPCAPQCHSWHIYLTELGREALKDLGADGCPTCNTKRGPCRAERAMLRVPGPRPIKDWHARKVLGSS